MTPISQDPARRIRRIQRYLEKCASAPRAYQRGNMSGRVESLIVRIDVVDDLLGHEIDWLCTYATELHAIAEQDCAGLVTVDESDYGGVFWRVARITDRGREVAEAMLEAGRAHIDFV